MCHRKEIACSRQREIVLSPSQRACRGNDTIWFAPHINVWACHSALYARGKNCKTWCYFLYIYLNQKGDIIHNIRRNWTERRKLSTKPSSTNHTLWRRSKITTMYSFLWLILLVSLLLNGISGTSSIRNAISSGSSNSRSLLDISFPTVSFVLCLFYR